MHREAFLFVEVGGVENRKTKRCEENRSKIDHSWSKKQKRAIGWREAGNHVGWCDPREGVPVLYLILSLPQSQGLLFIQLSNVRHFLPGGEPNPLFLRAAVSLAQIQPSAAPTFSWPPVHRHMFLGSNLGALVNPDRAAVGGEY